MVLLKHFLKDENGATAIEYGMIAALISVVIIGSVSTIAPGVNGTFSTASTALDTP